MKYALVLLFFSLNLYYCVPIIHAQEAPTSIASLGTEEHVGSKLSINQLIFFDENGKKVSFSNYFNMGIPVLLSVVNEGMDDTLLKDELSEALRNLPFTAPKSFKVVFVSSMKLKLTPNWTFLTGNTLFINQLENELGTTKTHPVGVYILKSDGEISRYLYGLNFHEKDIKFGLMEASDQKLGSALDKILYYCFHFDPIRNGYTVDLWRIVSIVLLIQALIVIIFLSLLWRRKRGSRINKAECE